MNARRIAALLFVLTIAGSASADFEREVIHKWNLRMAETVKLLKAQDHKTALRLANRTVNEMVDMLGGGDAAMAAFGLALTHKALAHAGLGQQDDARWYWQITTSLYPQLANDDLSMFGAAGQFLKSNSQPLAEPKTERTGSADVKPPRILKHVKPDFPRGANASQIGGALTVEAVITAEGTVRSPRIVTPLSAPTLSYAALESIKKSRFQPGTMDGRPVPVVFHFTVNYRPR